MDPNITPTSDLDFRYKWLYNHFFEGICRASRAN